MGAGKESPSGGGGREARRPRDRWRRGTYRALLSPKIVCLFFVAGDSAGCGPHKPHHPPAVDLEGWLGSFICFILLFLISLQIKIGANPAALWLWSSSPQGDVATGFKLPL